MGFIAPLISAVGPFILWPVELVLPYPYIVEELFKGVLVYFILDEKDKKLQEKFLLGSAVLFTLSESVLYIFNIFIAGSLGILFLRLAVTLLLHLGTFLIIFLFGRINIRLLPAGVLAGALIHYIFNSLISIFF